MVHFNQFLHKSTKYFQDFYIESLHLEELSCDFYLSSDSEKTPRILQQGLSVVTHRIKETDSLLKEKDCLATFM